MPNYEFRCKRGCVSDLVRPLGVEQAACPFCGEVAARTHRPTTFDVVGPTVDTRGLARRFEEAVDEREHRYQQAEAEVGHPIQRPNDLAPVDAKVRAMAHHGELPSARGVHSQNLQRSSE